MSTYTLKVTFFFAGSIKVLADTIVTIVHCKHNCFMINWLKQHNVLLIIGLKSCDLTMRAVKTAQCCFSEELTL